LQTDSLPKIVAGSLREATRWLCKGEDPAAVERDLEESLAELGVAPLFSEVKREDDLVSIDVLILTCVAKEKSEHAETHVCDEYYYAWLEGKCEFSKARVRAGVEKLKQLSVEQFDFDFWRR